MAAKYNNARFYIAENQARSSAKKHYLSGCDDVLALTLFTAKPDSCLISRDNYQDACDFVNIPPFSYYLIESTQRPSWDELPAGAESTIHKKTRISKIQFNPAAEFANGAAIYEQRRREHYGFCFQTDHGQKNKIYKAAPRDELAFYY